MGRRVPMTTTMEPTGYGWASTKIRYPRRSLVAAILGVYAFYVVLLASVLAWPFVPALGPVVLAAFALKIGAELFLLVPACRHFDQRFGHVVAANWFHGVEDLARVGEGEAPGTAERRRDVLVAAGDGL